VELQESNKKLQGEILVRKKAEKTLKESEERFKKMADSAPVLIWMSGKDKLCTYFNKVWLEFTGRTLEQELGNGWAEGVHQDDRERCLAIYLDSFNKRIPFEIEFRLRTVNGNYKWILNQGTPIYEEDEFVGYLGSCIDIHQRKRNEIFLHIQYSVSKTLAEARTIEEASKGVLENICSGIKWNFGVLWTIDEEDEYLHVESLWSDGNDTTNEYSGMYDRFYKLPKDQRVARLRAQRRKIKMDKRYCLR
jgi:PAS domain S-box-containing protein